MTGILILAVLALALIAGLEYSNRRHADASSAARRSGSWTRYDRDVARTKVDLFALAGKAEPFSRKPFSRVHHITPHGRHAA
jgi:fatty-acid desaturase